MGESHRNDHQDCLQNYTIDRLLGRGGSSHVYSARCNAGKLRGRRVALKIIPLSSLPTPTHLSHHINSTSIHSKLNHRSIVTLLAEFQSSSDYCQVLELCSITLSSFITSRPERCLTEPEVRVVGRALVDALLYLSRERVLHRDIKADNILLTNDGSVKLGDMGLATKLEPPNFEVSTFCGTPNYLSPEVIARRPYGAASELWAIGCLLITVLTGKPPFQGDTVEMTFEKASQASFKLPDSLSYEARDLIEGLIQIKPEHRIPLHRILSHAFFKPSLPITPLIPFSTSSSRNTKTTLVTTRDENKENARPAFSPSSTRRTTRKVPLKPSLEEMALLKEDALSTHGRPVLAPFLSNSVITLETPNLNPAQSTSRRNIRTMSKASSLSNHSTQVAAQLKTNPRRPSFTYTAPQDAHAETTGENKIHVSRTRGEQVPPAPVASSSKLPLRRTSHHQLNSLSRISPIRRILSTNQVTAPVAVKKVEANIPPVTRVRPQRLIAPYSVLTESTMIPSSEEYKQRIPDALDTSGIPARVHPMQHGQLEILPYTSALVVDLRVSERRAGKSGDEVLRISSDGDKIEVFKAVTLSVPYNFTRPSTVWKREDLPSRYWKRYRFAARFVEMVKSRTPKFIMFTPKAKCSLMSNGPNADIELLLPAPSRSSHAIAANPQPTMRVRFSPNHGTVEISRFVPLTEQTTSALADVNPTEPVAQEFLKGEWSKKVLPIINHFPSKKKTWKQGVDQDPQLLLSSALIDTLPLEERTGLRHLEECLTVCQRLESVEFMTSKVGSIPTISSVQDVWRSYVDLDAKVPEGDVSLVLRPETWNALQSRECSGDVEMEIQKTMQLSTSPLRRTSKRSTLASQTSADTIAVSPYARSDLNWKQASSLRRQALRDAVYHASMPPQPLDTSVIKVEPDRGPLKRGQRKSSPTLATNAPFTKPIPSVQSRTVYSSNSRFLKGIGWCTRTPGVDLAHSSFVVMYLDGASLEVDGKACLATLIDRHGKRSAPAFIDERMPRKIRERFAVFQEFLILFGDTHQL